MNSVSVLSELMVLIGPTSGHEGPASLDSTIPFSSLMFLPLILPSPGHGLRTLVAERANREGIQLNVGIEIDSYGGIKILVERGLGFSILPEHSVEKEVKERRLRAWHFDQPLRPTVYLVYPTDRPLSHAVSSVKSLCLKTLRQLVHTGSWRAAHMRIVA